MLNVCSAFFGIYGEVYAYYMSSPLEDAIIKKLVSRRGISGRGLATHGWNKVRGKLSRIKNALKSWVKKTMIADWTWDHWNKLPNSHINSELEGRLS
jgi:hypothetical protein